MTNFMSTAVNSIAATHPDAKVCCDEDAAHAFSDIPVECFPRNSMQAKLRLIILSRTSYWLTPQQN